MFIGRHFDRSVILLCVRWYLKHRTFNHTHTLRP